MTNGLNLILIMGTPDEISEIRLFFYITTICRVFILFNKLKNKIMIPLSLCIFGCLFLFLAYIENKDKLNHVLLGASFGCFFSAILVFLLLINN